ncbi:DUF2637 domain-containing protein [Rhodococcus ruber]|uniref:DUF2637 domain-containing protein n=1 Tax=Rhodococcus ruber TaxID=1830 RepID=UPI00177BC348|nr:DUF2637 domain-containing protein [Rhodococcus ruber]MBD8056454.1 DUF2637 domain-containing protein [Rhodococcus ruber]
MSDDTAQDATELQAEAPMTMQMKLAVAVVATMTLFVAALSFILSFDALQALAIEMGTAPERSWMPPVAIDVGQAAATTCFVVFRLQGRSWPTLTLCATIAVMTVLLSVGGNALHAWQTADRNLARIAAGEDIGYIPQVPWLAAMSESIFPVLWLALFHMFVLMLRRNDAPRGIPQSAAIATPAATAETAAASGVASHDESSAPRVASEQAVPAAVGNREDDPSSIQWPVAQADAPLPSIAATSSSVDAARTADKRAEAETTRNGYTQNQDGLLQFINDSDFHETVKIVASMMVTDPTLRQIDVADRLDIDKSTVSRRWRQFRQEAEAEGFTVPPLPLTEASEPMRETSRF